jgi:CheY-like chemotaxis protein
MSNTEEQKAMASILVVDDAVVDRRMVEGILSADGAHQVASVESGADALDSISGIKPDLVVSDLQMPEMNGLELVSQIQLFHPNLPVVLTTAHGSEELAVEALRAGAASYVPKTQVAECLLETVDEVLANIGADESYQRLAECVDSAAFEFTLDSNLDLLGHLVGLLQDVAGNSVRFQTGKLHRFAFGLSAALIYVMCRGNFGWSLEDFADLHSGRPEAVDRAKEQTIKEPFCDRKLRVNSRFTRDSVTIEITHDGDPLGNEILDFSPEKAMAGTSARGLVLMCAFFSSVELRDGGKTLVLGTSTQ